jgi:hypothetical protein
MWHANWPIENVKIENRINTVVETDNGAVDERYWLNSKGIPVISTIQYYTRTDQRDHRQSWKY